MSHNDEQKTSNSQDIVCKIPNDAKKVAAITKTVHSMPIQIQYSGPANVSTYFVPQVKPKYQSSLATSDIAPPVQEPIPEGEKFYSASFRGREVTGRVVNLTANNCVGLVIESGVAEEPVAQFQVRKLGVKRTAPAAATVPAEEAPEVKANATITTVFPELYVWQKDNNQIMHDYITRSVEQYCVLADALHGE